MKFKTKPFAHQLEVWDISKDKEYYALFMEQGTGKTKVSIDTINYLFDLGLIDGCLILAPNGVHSNWIVNELPVHANFSYVDHNWTGKKTKKELSRINDFFNDETDRLKVLAMNIESIRTDFGYKTADAFVSKHKTITIIDESTIIKNYKSLQGKAACKIGNKSCYRRILSGTPIAQSPLDMWGQVQFLDKTALPQSNYTAFKNQYAITILDNSGQRVFERILGYQNLDRLTESIKPFSFRVLKKDCLDLPEKVYQQEVIPLTTEQEKAYKDMKEMAFTMIEDGLITSTNAITTMLRFHQIVCGFVKDDMGEIHDIKNNRLERLLEMVQRIDGKVIIWAVFKHNIKQIKDALGDEAVTYYGDTPKGERDNNVHRFNNDPSVRFFVANEAASRGLTLVSSHTSIYFANNFKLETRLQSEDRNHRIGQRETVSYIDFVSPGTIDERIVRALKDKKNISDTVMRNVSAMKDLI